ncbi:Endonuclease/exonuclease/phosphatase [Paraphoma chrysanthemicola]|uniref:Endonuclease/exonuclease/phosphatase n=1 Tax=Paraphoma chrysanthemicola TaxID=798071 RepID=A0A8K0RE25_9PLEO|nr:Endonuclease/exonuclease/phosphatase [Paraphoma chrysanthemicola]
MSRDISPPPAKRRRTAEHGPGSTAAQKSAVPEPLPRLGSNTVRIISWNVNGISPFLQQPITSFFASSKSLNKDNATYSASLRGFLQRHRWPSILFLQEVKIARKDTKTQDAVRAALNLYLPEEADPETRGPMYEAHFILPDDPQNARGPRGSGKVYGVCSILRTDLRDAYNVSLRSVAWDKEGRISVVELQTSKCKLAVFNIYAVNGTTNPYRDPANGNVRGTRHDRKLEVHRLLMQECLKLQDQGWDVLLGGDMNVAPDQRDGHPNLRTFPYQHVLNRADFHQKLLAKEDNAKGLNGVDVWREMHDEERQYTYYSRGRPWGTSCDRVDYFIAGRTLWEKAMIKACGIMNTEAERGPSDHCPIWLDIDLELTTERTGKE